MKPSEFYSIDEKLLFSLSPDTDAEKYACLVKKFKESLMAIVVSNRDKDKIKLSKGDEIYLRKESQEESQVTPFRLIQNQSFPLLILDLVIAEEEAPVSIEEAAEEEEPTEEEAIAAMEETSEDEEPTEEEAIAAMEETSEDEEPTEEEAIAAMEETSEDDALEETYIADEEHPLPLETNIDEYISGEEKTDDEHVGEEDEETTEPLVEMDIPDEDEETTEPLVEMDIPDDDEEEYEDEDEETTEPLVEMDIPDDDEEEYEDEDEETTEPLVEMEIPDEDEEEDEEEEDEETAEPLVEMEISDDEEFSEDDTEGTVPFEGMIGTIEVDSAEESMDDTLSLEDEQIMNGFLIPSMDEPAPLELDNEDESDSEEEMGATPLMDTVGEEYENPDEIGDMAISDDYLEYTPVNIPQEEDAEFVYLENGGDETLDETLDETMKDSSLLPGAWEVESVQYLGSDDISRMETEEEYFQDETPEAGFYLPPPLDEEPPGEAEGMDDEDQETPEDIEEHDLEEEFSLDMEDTGQEEEPSIGDGFFEDREMMHAEDLSATSTDLGNSALSEEDIDILDRELLGTPGMDDDDLGMGKPQESGSFDEEEVEEEEEEENVPGYPEVDDFQDMEVTTSIEFNMMDLEPMIDPSKEDLEEGEEPITIKEEGRNYAFDDIDDTVKILAPYSDEDDDTLSGFMLDDLKDIDQDPISFFPSDRPLEEEEEVEPMLEMRIPDEGLSDEPLMDSFNSTAKIPKPSIMGMVSPPGVFEDYFGFRFSQVSPGLFPTLNQLIMENPTSKRRPASPAAPSAPGGDTLQIPDSVDKDVKNAILKLMEKVTALESQVRTGGQPPLSAPVAGPSTTGEAPRAICISINSAGLMAAITGAPPPQNVPILISIDRPWEPPLRVDTLAEMASAEKKEGGLHMCYFRFTAIHEEDKDNISEYIARSADIFDKIQRALKT
ncbi:MAG: hypothetical protein OEZ55_06130 [Nitrospinota bacterium]|nr:hypothetical protein [Nitrospinota bacterium]